jgi:type IV secretion system protein VirB10
VNLPFSHPRPERSDPGDPYDVRPLVAIRKDDRSAWWFAGGAIIAASLLFAALEARRQAASQAEARSGPFTSYAAPEAVPDLVIPTAPDERAATLPATGPWLEPGNQRARAGSVNLPPPVQAPARSYAPAYQPQPVYSDGNSSPPPPAVNGTAREDTAFDGAQSPAGPAEPGAGRVRAGRLDNPATTVMQGTLINAVLETALDSTRPGLARALVTRDVYGFDGKRLLIPRGTRLYGVYEADVAQGQKRAQIRWTRLLRPDGVTLALDSPAADPLGRAGVTGKVNNHFFQRLGNALIGTTANVGSALVTRSIAPSSPVVVAVPGATQQVSQTVAPGPAQILPTLTVRQGTRVTVFVQHDLDFTAVDSSP